MLSPQLQAERSHVLKLIIFELGGLAHDHMSLEELDSVIDNMLSKGVPTSISSDLTRWIHTHRKQHGFKIQQILGTVMSDKHSLVPDCFARFFDGTAVECKVCLDRAECKRKCVNNSSADVTVPAERVHQVYPISKRADVEDLREVLSHKTGQIARALSHGTKVVLVVSHNQLQVLTVDGTKSQEDNMSKKPDTKSKKAQEDLDEEEEEATPKTTKKGKAAPAPAPEPDEDDEDLDMEDLDEEEDSDDEDADEDEDEEEEEKPSKSKKAAKPEPKAKKEKKAPAPLNKLQAEFVDKLKTDYKDNDALFKMAKKLGVKWERKEDPRIDRMLCVMAVKKHLGEQGAPAAKAKSKK